MAGREGEVVVGLARERGGTNRKFSREKLRGARQFPASPAQQLSFPGSSPSSRTRSLSTARSRRVKTRSQSEPKRPLESLEPSRLRKIGVCVCVCVCVFCGCVRVLPGERVSVVCWCVCARSLFYYTLFPALLPPFFSQSHKFRSIAPERIVSSFFPRHFTAASSFFFSFFFLFRFRPAPAFSACQVVNTKWTD